jgi:hypothetical protein
MSVGKARENSLIHALGQRVSSTHEEGHYLRTSRIVGNPAATAVAFREESPAVTFYEQIHQEHWLRDKLKERV